MDHSRGRNLLAGRHHDGNPATDLRGSRLEAEFFNMVGDELVNVVEEANLDPDYTDRTQVMRAIILLARQTSGASYRLHGEAQEAVENGDLTAGDLVAMEGFVIRGIDPFIGIVEAVADADYPGGGNIRPVGNFYTPIMWGADPTGGTDSSAAIKAAWRFCMKQGQGESNRAMLFFPAGTYLVTENNVFGQFGDAYVFPGNIFGAAQGTSTIVFRPTTGTNAFGDDKYFLYDGGRRDDPNPSTILRARFKNLSIDLDGANLNNATDTIGFYRCCGDKPGQCGQNYVMSDCRVDGAGPGAGVTAPVSVVYYLDGRVCASECGHDRSVYKNLTHVGVHRNPQGVDTTFFEPSLELIWGDLFRIEGGALEIRMYGGSIIWADGADGATHDLIHITGKPATGPGNMLASFTGLKCEMRSPKAGLLHARDVEGSVFVNFNDCNFGGGGISGRRVVATLGSNKALNFTNCAIPDAFDIHFAATDNTFSAYPNRGLVQMRQCSLAGDVHTTRDADGGRLIIHDDCMSTTGLASDGLKALAFDSNPWNVGTREPGPQTKRALIRLNRNGWCYLGTEHAVTLPPGAIITKIEVFRPSFGGEHKITLHIGNGDKSRVYANQTSAQNAGHRMTFTPDISAWRRAETDADRIVRIWAEPSFTAYGIGGFAFVEYI